MQTKKFLTYASFVVASLLVIALFVTATTYTQLVLAIILYPGLAYFALKIFPPRRRVLTTTVQQAPAHAHAVQVAGVGRQTMEVADFDKRTFLKLVGATGVFFFISSLLGKRVDTLFLGKTLQSVTSTSPSNQASANQGGSLAASGYNIAEIDDGITSYYGFTNKDGSWLIMREDTDTNSFRYSKGSSDFPGNWSKRRNLKYDYYYNLF